MCHKDDRPLLGLGPLAELSQGVVQVDGVVADAVLRRRGPEVRNVGIVAPGENAAVGDVLIEQVHRPEDAAGLVRPRRLAVSRQAVDEDDAGVARRIISTSTWKAGARDAEIW